MNLTRRPATEQDVPRLLALRHDTLGGHLIAAGEIFDDVKQLARVMDRLECVQVLLQENAIVGLFKVARDDTAWQIMQIQIAPELQGRGIGAALVREVIAEARVAKAALTLSVLKVNPARALYERLGFRVEGESGLAYHMRWYEQHLPA